MVILKPTLPDTQMNDMDGKLAGMHFFMVLQRESMVPVCAESCEARKRTVRANSPF